MTLDPNGPTSSSDELFSREEALGGLPARDAGSLLFLIESRTAHMAARSRDVLEPFLTERTVEERDLDFLDAFALGRDPPLRPTIQNLEAHARDWAPLVADASPQVRAALARAMSQKYALAHGRVASIGLALGLEQEPVARAYSSLYRQPLDSIYVHKLGWIEHLRWRGLSLTTGVLSLPPFWLATLLIVSFSLPQAMIAMPIVFADVGPLPGILAIVALGGFNVITMAYTAEAAARSGTVRFGVAALGKLAQEYLGGLGSALVTTVFLVFVVVAMIAGWIGLATTLADLIPLRAELWAGAIFLGGLYLFLRGSTNFTLGIVVFLAVVIFLLFAALIVRAFFELEPSFLLHTDIPLLNGRLFDRPGQAEIFGVILMAYFGHLFVLPVGKVVLPRDPSGRALILGSTFGSAVLTLFFCVWIMVINGALGADALGGLTGTPLEAMSAKLGASATVIGSALITLLLGLATLRAITAIANLVGERLPATRSGSMGPRRAVDMMLGERGRRYVLAGPFLLVFLVVELLFYIEGESYIGALGFGGIIASTFKAGFFPVLLLVASRRKSDYALDLHVPFIGHPLVTTVVYVLFLGLLLLHAAVIWQVPAQQGAAAVAALVAIAAPFVFRMQGAFTRRLVVELRQYERTPGAPEISMVAAGQPAQGDVELEYVDGRRANEQGVVRTTAGPGLRSVNVDLPIRDAKELKVWAHSVNGSGESQPLRAVVDVEIEGATSTFDLSQLGGKAMVQLRGNRCRVRITLGTDPRS